jgi:putative ABC transport system permease protein
MQRWLEDFAYRIDIGPGVFVLAIAATLAVALATVSAQALRAAWMDPAPTLRSE